MNYLGINAKNNDYLVTRYQTASQIAGAIIKAIDESKPAAEVLAKKLKHDDKLTSAKMIFLFCKNFIPYKKESGQRQTAKTLQRIISDNSTGDCKHYSITAASLCKALNIPVKLRLISQKFNDATPNHIYVVAIIDGKEVIIDGVLKSFNNEARYDYKYDIKI